MLSEHVRNANGDTFATIQRSLQFLGFDLLVERNYNALGGQSVLVAYDIGHGVAVEPVAMGTDSPSILDNVRAAVGRLQRRLASGVSL